MLFVIFGKDVKNWLDSATDGVIYFSLGSIAKSAQLSTEKRDAILKSLSKLKQKILWKWEDNELPDKPDNVMISKWLPQSDILAHPNTVLFISHCGLSSINEAKYHGVPILGIPIFGDQPINLAAVKRDGWAVGCPLNNLTEVNFSKALHEILADVSYRETVRRISALYRDRLENALDTAVYWTEYVVRHKGAKHLQSPAVHLNFIQSNSLDVIGFIFIIIYLIFKLTKVIWCYFWRKCFSVSKVKIKIE